MPDWSYQTVFRPLLFRLPATAARSVTLGAFGLFGKMPGGSFVIRTMGHMELSPLLESRIRGTVFKYPVGLCGGLDVHVQAHCALSQIGFGFIEVGPVTSEPVFCNRPVMREKSREAILYPDPYVNDGVDAILKKVQSNAVDVPLMFRLRHTAGSTAVEAREEIARLCEKVSDRAAGYVLDCLDERWSLEETIQLCDGLVRSIRSQSEEKPILLYIPLEYPINSLQQLMDALHTAPMDGVVLGDGLSTERGFEVGRDGKRFSMEKVVCVREACGDEPVIFVAGGIHEPQDALDVMEAGANGVQLHSGLVYAGPGLPKRVNEAVLYERLKEKASPSTPPFFKHWGWMCLLGLGMMIGGLLAWIIAATTVLLPYDEAYLGLTAAQLESLYPQVIAFMSHDRITLAGTMISIGVMYFLLGYHGLRHEIHWAKTALMTSGVVGFCSFFLYLGYGYFDPLHALAAAVLLPMFVLAMRGGGGRVLTTQPNLRNDQVWVLAQ